MEVTLPDVESQEQRQQSRKDAEKLVRDQARDDLRWIMRNKAGRRFMWELLSAAHIFAPSYIPGDVGGTQFREGERNVGLQLITRIMADCNAEFLEMLSERNAHANPA